MTCLLIANAKEMIISTFFQPEVAQRVIEAETHWSLFIAKHNIAFLNSDHASKLFAKMFNDSGNFHVLEPSVQL